MESNTDRNLKNVKQIGTPREENKIYIENMTYNKIKEDSYHEKRVFVLMGHTERMGEKYATFIEAAISVSGIEFSGNLPRWNNTAWSEVFREIKHLYEDMIIVGWALDVKGMPARMTPDLERIHREHFGGVHQLLFLLDSLEKEEQFYIYKENKLLSKDGFYIYHKARSKERVTSTPVKEEVIQTIVLEKPRGGQYRQFIQAQKKPERDTGNIGIAVAVAILVFVIGVGVYENSGGILGKKDSIEANAVVNQDPTELDEEETEKNEIEIEIIPGNE
ncbi:MAG: hypothetical protein IKJ16_06740 [Agathobacter sp.]|nr:hypothetical protein [Agathobacter sp.]